MPSTRPGLAFDATGICAACRWFEQKGEIDWVAREQELRDLVGWALRESYGPWGCILGVSGGKDSTWQACYLRDHLGINPLLVQYASAEGNERGRRCLENLVSLGFSLVSSHAAAETARTLSRKSLRNYGNLVKYQEIALFTAPFRVAMQYEIPLVFFGENPALECGDSNLDKGAGWDATTIRYNNTLAGAALGPWLGDGVGQRDLLPYVFPPEDEFQRWGGKGVFMGYYIPWCGYRNALFSIQRGMECTPEPHQDIGNLHRHVCLDWDFIPVNSLLKHRKLGFGHTTEFACYDIREGRITREEAIALVRELDGRCASRFVAGYCEWSGVPVTEFWEIVDRFSGPMWDRNAQGTWHIKEPIWLQEPPSSRIDVPAVLQRIDSRYWAARLGHLPVAPVRGEDFTCKHR